MKKVKTTALYSTSFAAYWSMDCIIVGYASVYLQANDYSNTLIGIIVGAANLLSVIVQAVTADIADRSRKLNLFDIVVIMAIVIAASEVFLLLLKGESAMMFIAYTVALGVHLAHQPQLNAMTSVLASRNLNVDYGICRGMGSLAFAITSLLMGALAAKSGIIVLSVGSEIGLLFLMLAVTAMGFLYRKAADCEIKKGVDAQNISIREFISRHKMFFVMNVGIFILFYQHQVTNNFMLQVFQSTGGGTKELSIYYFFMPFTDAIVFLTYSLLRKHFSLKTLLKFSVIMFIVRGLMMVVARSSLGIILSLIAHPFCFPLFVAAIVDYINRIMLQKEVVRGQSLYVIAITASALVTSLTGGAIVDMWGAKALLIVAFVLTIVGVAVVIPMVALAEKETIYNSTDLE